MPDFEPNQDLAFPQGSLILVTGVSGMIAIHIADEALKAGFRVRGTTQSVEKGKAVTNYSNLRRVVPAEGAVISGQFIPGGTIISVYALPPVTTLATSLGPNSLSRGDGSQTVKDRIGPRQIILRYPSHSQSGLETA
ncbi:MAG: hypothetical protein M1821_000557 [Bathelium mastoideum]|nr:MAG: hypothetical protein M1821_000557 [Bathelium mastoideum]KAI9683022.1 MAG: hypothetical protein M1822_006215 [Bathelium mastoideum]